MNPTTKPAPAVTGQIFPNFGPLLTYSEGVKSATAIRKGIANVPNVDQYKNMCKAYKDFYVPICNKFGKLPVSSFFRSAALNKAIGGATSSAHLAGTAMDIDCDGLGYPTNRQLFDWIRVNLNYDQIILENPNPVTGEPAWVHVANSRNGEQNRMQVLVMHRVNGKATYELLA